MRSLKIGDVTITSIIERDGPWRQPEDMFPAYDAGLGRRYLAEMDPEVYDAASNRMVITYQTFVVRNPKHTVLIDTCTGEDKGYPPPMDFPKQPWLANFAAAGVDDAQAHAHALSNLVTKQEAITRTLEKGRQEGDATERGQTEFARFSHAPVTIRN